MIFVLVPDVILNLGQMRGARGVYTVYTKVQEGMITLMINPLSVSVNYGREPAAEQQDVLLLIDRTHLSPLL